MSDVTDFLNDCPAISAREAIVPGAGAFEVGIFRQQSLGHLCFTTFQWRNYPLVMTNSLPWKPWPIKIDGLPINSMVDLSMAM